MIFLLIWYVVNMVVNKNCLNKIFFYKCENKLIEKMLFCLRMLIVCFFLSFLFVELEDVFNYLNFILIEMVDNNMFLFVILVNIFYWDFVFWSGYCGIKLFLIWDGIGLDGNIVYWIGSIIKIFFVILLYKLYEDRMIGLFDDFLSKYIFDFSIKNFFIIDNIIFREIVS